MSHKIKPNQTKPNVYIQTNKQINEIDVNITRGQVILPFIQKWQLRLLSSVASCNIKRKKINDEGENIDKFQKESFNGSMRRRFPLCCV